MDKVLIWGTNSVYAINREEIKQLVADGKAEVLALIDNFAETEELDGCRVIRQEGISGYDYDYILLAISPLVMPEVSKAAAVAGVPAAKLIGIGDYFQRAGGTASQKGDKQKKVVEQQKKVLADILHSSAEEIHDYKWLYKKIWEFGIYPFGKQWKENTAANYSEYGLMQIPEEFAGYCQLLSYVKATTAIEVGVFSGRSSYFMCAVLARINPELTYYMIDIVDRLDNFAEYEKLLPNLKKCIPSTSADYEGKRFDAVFIDADHSYDGSIADWRRLGRHAGVLTGFHDIYAHEYDGENGGTVRMWQEVAAETAGQEKRVFSVYPDKWMGIGCVLFDKKSLAGAVPAGEA